MISEKIGRDAEKFQALSRRNCFISGVGPLVKRFKPSGAWFGAALGA
jgi:hypothetical protein